MTAPFLRRVSFSSPLTTLVASLLTNFAIVLPHSKLSASRAISLWLCSPKDTWSEVLRALALVAADPSISARFVDNRRLRVGKVSNK